MIVVPWWWIWIHHVTSSGKHLTWNTFLFQHDSDPEHPANAVKAYLVWKPGFHHFWSSVGLCWTEQNQPKYTEKSTTQYCDSALPSELLHGFVIIIKCIYLFLHVPGLVSISQLFLLCESQYHKYSSEYWPLLKIQRNYNTEKEVEMIYRKPVRDGILLFFFFRLKVLMVEVELYLCSGNFKKVVCE